MAVRTPSPQTTLVILLGASEWPHSPEFPASKAFRNSARELRKYLLDPSQFGLSPENLLNLFDSNHSSDEIDQEIGQFINTCMEEMKQDGQHATDLLVYFIGHGGFVGNDSEFYLALRRTRTENPSASGIRLTSLAYTLKEKARYLRRIVILDCCFAGAAFRAFQASGPAQVAIVKTVDAFEVQGKGAGLPERGTSLLCSSRHNAPSLLSKDGTYTLFSLALVRALSKGHPRRPDRLSLRDIADLTEDILHEMPEENAPRPEVHSPDQSDGDVAGVPFFPNPAKEMAHPLTPPPPTPPAHQPPNSPSPFTRAIRTFSRGKFLLIGLIIIFLFLTGAIGIQIYTNYVNNIHPPSASHSATAVAATATMVVKNPDPYPPYTGKLALYDLLSQPDQWANSSNSSFGAACQFTNGAYHTIQSKPNSLNDCDTSSSNFSNFAFEVQMTIVKGDCGGIEFRANIAKGSGYDFEVCQNGSYNFYLYRDKTAANARTLISSSSPAIRTGLSQSNLIAVVANGSTLDLYVNTQKIDSINDATYSQGEIGLIASTNNNSTEVVYSRARVWTI